MIRAAVPVRICDLGGWTDTWFGGPGRVVNIGITPGVEVTVDGVPGPSGVTLEVFDQIYTITPRQERVARYPLVEAAVDRRPPPAGLAVHIRVRSDVPAGCGAGTSAAVTVALLAALSVLAGDVPGPAELARDAHSVEVEGLGLESGVQDQLSAAHGGINYIEVGPYPNARVTALPAWEELDARLLLVYLGRAHDSYGLHSQVIDEVKARPSGAFDRLREAALEGKEAVLAGDLAGFGAAMVGNTQAQRDLHPALVGPDAARVIEAAAAAGAIGWKVNGAGGDGGSLTLLCADPAGRARTSQFVTALNPAYTVLPARVSREGVLVRRDA